MASRGQFSPRAESSPSLSRSGREGRGEEALGDVMLSVELLLSSLLRREERETNSRLISILVGSVTRECSSLKFANENKSSANISFSASHIASRGCFAKPFNAP